MNRAGLLAEFVATHRTRSFEWGVWDCAQFCATWVQMLTGVDHRTAFDAYVDESGASDILAAKGGLAALMDTRFAPIHPSRAVCGDIVLARQDLALGICIGVRSAHVSKAGLVYRKTVESVRAWRVE